MEGHGNSNKNTNPPHLYEIRDSVDDDVFKFGISDEPIDEEGQSNRMKLQVNFLNLGVNWLRFFARILFFDISDRKTAGKIEKEHLKKYKDLNGRRPRGNLED
jgi:URI fold toxin 2